jgi:glutamine synthetase
VHVSLKSRDDGRNIFAVSDADDLQTQTGRADAAFEDSKWLSKEGEWFLAGVLDGLADVVPLVRG